MPCSCQAVRLFQDNRPPTLLNLQYIRLGYTGVEDFSPLAELPGLKQIAVSDSNRIGPTIRAQFRQKKREARFVND